MFENKKTWFKLIGIAIAVATWYYAIHQIMVYYESGSPNFTFSFSTKTILFVLCVILLMVVNWAIETIKWQFSLSQVTIISFKLAFKTVLSGITLGLITPNRSGEPIGRVSFLPKQYRQQALGAGIMCSVSQFTTTVFAGCMALPFFLFDIHYRYTNLLFLGSLLLAVFSLLCYFHFKYLLLLFKRIKYLQKYEVFIAYFGKQSSKIVLRILLLSFCRFTIFLLQFYISLKLFDCKILFEQSCIAVSLVYAVTTIIPTTTLAELGIRSSTSLFFIGFYTNQSLGIVSASITLWIINVTIPALIGSLFYMRRLRSEAFETHELL